MTENFAQLLKESLEQTDLRPGSVITATITHIGNDNIIVNAGLKSDAMIPIEEFQDDRGQLQAQLGEKVKVVVETIEDGFGETRLSREKAKRAEAWRILESAYENK